MTKDEAIDLVCDIASRWGENAEEGLPQRLTADMTDTQIEEIFSGTDYDRYDFEQAIEIRNLWIAIHLLTKDITL